MSAAPGRDPVLLDGGPGVVLAGHVAGGGGPAHVVVLRTGGLALFGGAAATPAGWWRSPALDAAEVRHDAAGCATAAGVHHGVNSRGLFCACVPAGPAARAGLAGALLGCAGGVEEAAVLLDVAAAALEGADTVWLADAGAALRVDLDGAGAHRSPLAPSAAGGAGLGGVRARLRDGPAPDATSAIAARLDASGAVLLVCLGSPAAGVFVRQWPGLPPPPVLAGADGRPPLLGVLAAAAATAPLTPDAAAALAAAEAEALAEGEAAERMARLMDAAGDDHGGEVRRALAQAHAAGIAVAVLEPLVPAVGAGPDPSL